MSREPVRWLESTEHPELLRLMRVGAEEVAPADALARVAERLRESGLVSEVSSAPPRAVGRGLPARAGTTGLGAKALGLAALLGVVGLSLWLYLLARPSAPGHPSTSAEQDREPLADAPSVAPPPGAPETAALDPQVAAPPDTSLAGEQAPLHRDAQPAARARRVRARTRALPSEPSAQSLDARLREARLLEQARKELSARPDHALALLREHATHYPQSWLEEERAALLIRALAETGQRELARTQLTRFKARFPTSLQARRLEQALAAP